MKDSDFYKFNYDFKPFFTCSQSKVANPSTIFLYLFNNRFRVTYAHNKTETRKTGFYFHVFMPESWCLKVCFCNHNFGFTW